MMDAAYDAASSIEESLEDAITQRPLATVGLALGIGFLIGVAWRGKIGAGIRRSPSAGISDASRGRSHGGRVRTRRGIALVCSDVLFRSRHYMFGRMIDDFKECTGTALRLTSLAAAAAFALLVTTSFLCAALFVFVLQKYGPVEACLAGAASSSWSR